MAVTVIARTDASVKGGPSEHDNTRDLGGLPCGAGRIRQGRLWRGAAFDRTLPAIAATLAGPLHFFDLRRSAEVKGVNGDRPPNPHHWPLSDPGDRHPPSLRDADYFVTSAGRLVPELGGCLTDLLNTLATSDDPVFIGCRLGKDRTGLVVLVLGELLGVSRPALVADYMRTADAFRRSPGWVRNYAAGRGEPVSEVLRRLTPTADIPRRILAGLGPDRDRLRRSLRIDDTLLSAARTALVERPPIERIGTT